MVAIYLQTKSRRLAGRAIRQFETQAPKVLLYLFQLAQGAQGRERGTASRRGRYHAAERDGV